ncbi:hypothetical protein NKH47_12480 [Mesorhizobium sp. M1060]|uniref:hypothetical protein n=1 Tax=Mesorhizobium sp. L2C089B000 TaxID=1287120 RepID=UPI001FD8B419|nr:hypothetical protein [Mesorhizobium sp. L2C089B000]
MSLLATFAPGLLEFLGDGGTLGNSPGEEVFECILIDIERLYDCIESYVPLMAPRIPHFSQSVESVGMAFAPVFEKLNSPS